MPIKINRLKSRPTCKVRFKLDPEDVADAENVCIVGSFNEWDEKRHPMKKNKNGSFTLEIELPNGEEISFRYHVDNERWLNEKEASEYRYCEFACADNSILRL
ncbi:MAG: isoamylase early set domain-containing protein [Deltaproteobacteria bacterium]|jgi:1,4-alpha-glucan branching enzyme|nr:isoamylase early set domain-containing protein [Deltaproteobacteria bacterium]